MLETTYLGLNLKNPIVPSSSPLTRSLHDLRQLEDCGAGAVVLHSLFEEEINAESHTLDAYLAENSESHAEALSYFPEMTVYKAVGPDVYLDRIRQAKAALDIPVIASLNGVSTGGWIKYAKYIEEAGADALEINLYYLPTDPMLSGNEVEQVYLQVVKDIRASVSLPLVVKLNPFFSSLPNTAKRFHEAGAAGLSLFNRFYQPDIDLETLEVVPSVKLSNSYELGLPLRWIAILYGRIPVDFGLTTGVHTATDALKGIAAGASITMMASALLQEGPWLISKILDEMTMWLREKEYESLAQLKGSMSQINCPNPAAFERANYIKAVGSYVLKDKLSQSFLEAHG